jgi:hypothetical protein
MSRLSGIIALLIAPVALNAQESQPGFEEKFADASLPAWTREPAEFKSVQVERDRAVLQASRWSGLRSKAEFDHLELRAEITILQAAREFRFFGESWSVWPDRTFGDQGFEAALLVRGGKDSGYRVQLSHKGQNVVLVKYPEGGYLRVAPCPVQLDRPHVVEVSARGNVITVTIDGKERIRCLDGIQPLEKGAVGLLASSGAKVAFGSVRVRTLPAGRIEQLPEHTPRLSVRKWLGDRSWVFDGDEPILLLPHPASSTINNVKLRPGYKPQLSWNSHWDVQNQGAYKEATNDTTNVTTSGVGATLEAKWSGKHVKDRFVTRTTMTVGWNPKRQVYTYDVDSELEVLPGEPFHFRYGYDFEHHTPLDPFRWQYLIVQREKGELVHRPVYPIDPGPLYDVETYHGKRVWYGRHLETMLLAPAVEYEIHPSFNDKPRKLTTAVCAAFYDTGVSFGQETAAPGTRVKVRYRYTGYPAAEAEALFKESKIYDAFTLDPNQHWLFADEWPKLTFRDSVPLSQTWIYGRHPFLTAHNSRPTYELAQNTGVGSGFAMKLPPASWGKADVRLPEPLSPGRYVLTAVCKSDNAHGAGGRIELTATQAKTNKVLASAVHHVGNGSFAWKSVGLSFDIPAEAAGLSLGLGNRGTGAVYFTDIEWKKWPEGMALPVGVAATPRTDPPRMTASPAGAIADYRMEEGKGRHVLDCAGGPLGHLELANLTWVTDEGRPALRFADNATGAKDWPRAGALERGYFSHEGYRGKETLPLALAGMHGGGQDYRAFTLAAWIKPAAQMGKAQHGGKGDIIGVGARRVILRLEGQNAPYRLSACLNVNDSVTADVKLDADRWYHVAVTGEATPEKVWRVRVYLDGKLVKEGQTQKFAAPALMPPSLILGAELFYFHDSYYRGLIGRTLVFDRALSKEELAALLR